MSFATELAKSASALRVLVEIDFANPNVQWVNYGAGIWKVSATNTYSEVDTTIFGSSGFSAQAFGVIASVRVDGLPLTKVATLPDVTTTADSFYYDSATEELYIRLTDYTTPFTHVIAIGTIYGYSQYGFSPPSGPGVYEGRVVSLPNISVRRDPLFYGRLVFSSGTVRLLNGDGEFDTFGVSKDIYGNECRIRIGFDGLDYTAYDTVFTGYITSFSVSETEATFTIADRRKQLTKPITYVATSRNALQCIREILSDNYGYAFDSRYYDVSAWQTAEDAVGNVSINMQSDKPEPAIDVIEDIAASVFGLFQVDADDKFTFKIVDSTESVGDVLPALDVLTPHSITYDPTEILSSVRVGYGKDWATTGTQYTYFTEATRETSVFNAYKTYKQRDFDTLLDDATAASAHATTLLNYFDTVRGKSTITVPIEHYTRAVGSYIGVTVDRGAQSMLGEYRAEITGKYLSFETPTIRFDVRYTTTVESILTTEASETLTTEADELLMEDS